MRRQRTRTGACLAGILVLAACSTGSNDPERLSILRTIGLSQPPPDEFLVVERHPLEMPTDLRDLPPPNPEGRNLVDPRPRAEVTALLNGAGLTPDNPGNLSPGEVAFLATASPTPPDPAIRDRLVKDDKDLQTGGRRYGFGTLFGVRTYDPYKNQLLDPFAEVVRLRAAGVQTPAAPPAPPPPNGLKLF
jgi:Protein of unknown function (DUF3035)